MKKNLTLTTVIYLALMGLVFLVSFFVAWLSSSGTPPFGPFQHGYLGGQNFLAIERVSFSAQSRFLFFGLISWVLFGTLYFLVGLFKKTNPLLSRLFLISFFASILLAATTALFSPRRKASFDFDSKRLNFIYSRYLFFPVTQTIDFKDIESISHKVIERNGIWISQINLKPINNQELLLGYALMSDSTGLDGKALVAHLQKKIRE